VNREFTIHCLTPPLTAFLLSRPSSVVALHLLKPSLGEITCAH
jgi:hypothetical protein